MAGKTSGWIKVATAGPTSDNREIKDVWLSDIADTYDPKEYTANLFKDHWPWSGNFGQVLAAKEEKDDKGRRCLFVKLFANELLLKLNRSGQALFTSIYVIENFAETGRAYLGHLAITDTPASVGTEQLSFSQAHGAQLFTLDSPIELNFDDETDDELAEKVRQRPGLFARLFKTQSLPQPQEQDSDMKKEDLDKLFQRLDTIESKLPTGDATDGKNESDQGDIENNPQFKELQQKFAQLEKRANDSSELKTELETLRAEFNAAVQDETPTPRPPTGDATDSFSVF